MEIGQMVNTLKEKDLKQENRIIKDLTRKEDKKFLRHLPGLYRIKPEITVPCG